MLTREQLGIEDKGLRRATCPRCGVTGAVLGMMREDGAWLNIVEGCRCRKPVEATDSVTTADVEPDLAGMTHHTSFDDQSDG